MAPRRHRIKAAPNIWADKRRAKTDRNETLLENKTSVAINSSNLLPNGSLSKDLKEVSQIRNQDELSNWSMQNNEITKAAEMVTKEFSSPTNESPNLPNLSENQEQDENLAQNVSTSKRSSPSREYVTQHLSKYQREIPDKSTLKLRDCITYNPTSNRMVYQPKRDANDNGIGTKSYRVQPQFMEERNESINRKNVETEKQAAVPQLKLGANGDIILDEKSLLIETTAEKQARTFLSASTSALVWDEYNDNNGFHSRQKRTKAWTADETKKFYKCLHTFGTDFCLMQTLFADRNRRDLKLKFKKEERNNNALIKKTLLNPLEFNMDVLNNDLQRDEKNVELQQKAEEEKKMKLEKKIKEEISIYSKRENRNKNVYSSRAMNNLTEGNLALNLADITNAKIKLQKKTDAEMKENFFNEEMPNVSKSLNCMGIENNLNENTESNDFVQNHPTNSDEIEVDADVELNGVASLNSFGFDDSCIIEITDIGEFLPLEDILSQYPNSTLAVVSKRDQNNPENDTHGIYIFWPATATLSRKPLDLPEDTLNSILTAMGKI